MSNDMKLIMENWRKGQERLLQEELLQEGVLDFIKTGFKKLMSIPNKFSSMVEKAKLAYQRIMMEKLKNDPQVQNMAKDVAETINASANAAQLNEKAFAKQLTPDDLRSLGLTDEQVVAHNELLSQKNAESVVESAEEVVGKTAPPAVKDWLVRFIKRSSKMTVFGFVDNFIMIMAGDYIDPTLARVMGTSTMFAAGIGNMISDMAGEEGGMALDKTLEKVGLDIEDVSDEQMVSAPGWMRLMDKRAGTFGVAIGCILGLVALPLRAVFTEEKEK